MASKKKQRVSFEEGMQALEGVIAAMSSGELSLEESIKAYEEGLIENIDGMIQKEYIQDILEKIKETDWDGKLKSIKDKLDEKCSYETIKAVIAKNKKGCYNEEESSADVPDSSNNTPQEPSDIETPKE